MVLWWFNVLSMKNLIFILTALFLLSGCANGEFSTPDLKIPKWKMPDWSLFGGQPDKAQQSTTGYNTKDNSITGCPNVILVPDLSRIVQFQGQHLVAETRITGVSRQCTLSNGAIGVTIALEAVGHLGEQGQKDAKIQANYTYPYLLAVVDPAGQIVAKDVFALNAVYRKGQSSADFHDQITQFIPFQNGAPPVGYSIQIGFQLSPAELEYNRRYK